MLKYAGVCQLCIHKSTVDLASPLCRISGDAIEVHWVKGGPKINK